MSLKQELDEALQQRVAGEERLAQMEAALRECMQQLRFVREEQEKRIHDAVMKTSKEFEKSQLVLEEKLAETSKRLAKLGGENSHLKDALLLKEKLIAETNKQLRQVETEFSVLMTRLKSTDKDNSSLKYEVRVLEKELEIRNEEREFNRRTADASHKQHLDSVKKIAKLESECQRLRLLVRKRLPGPAALAKMKNEVEMLGRDSLEMRRRKMNTTDFLVDNSFENPNKKIGILTEQLCAMEEESKNLKDALHKKTNELQFSREMYARTASKLSQVESRSEEVSKGPTVNESTGISISHDLASMSDIGSDDKASCAESWASALITELEHFRNGRQKGSPSSKTVGTSDLNLMEDFVEMERLALVSVDKPFASSHVSSLEANAISCPLKTEENGNPSQLMDRETVPMPDCESDISVSNQEIRSKDNMTSKFPGWLQDILKAVLEQNQVKQRNLDEIFDNIRAALAYINSPNPIEVVNPRESSSHADASSASLVSGYISWKPSSKSSVMVLSDGVTDVDVSETEKSKSQLQSDLNKSIGRIIELIEGISMQTPEDDNTENFSRNDRNVFTFNNSETSAGYMVRVLQWKTTELSAVLQQFVHSCYDLLNGKADIEKFCHELTAALDWIMNHCFSLQDVSNMRDAIMKRFEWDESRSESEAEVGMIGYSPGAGHVRTEQLLYLPMSTASNGNCLQMEEIQSTVKEEISTMKAELRSLESVKKDLEGRLLSATDKGESLMNQLRKAESTIAGLQTELEMLKESKGKIEEQIESHKLSNEDLDRQLTVARVELSEARQNFSSIEVELDDKNNCCAELEATCLELQLQLERFSFFPVILQFYFPKYNVYI